MTPRRLPSRRNWPSNLTAHKVDGRLYYIYRNPVTGHKHGLGYDFAHAKEVAAAVNHKLGIGRVAAEKILGIKGSRLDEYVDLFLTEKLPTLKVGKGAYTRGLSETTLAGYRQRLAVIRAHWEGRDMRTISIREMADFLAQHPPRMSNVYRATLMVLWRYARAAGWVEATGPDPSHTIQKDEQVQRLPLDKDGYEAVKAQAEPWMQRAMELALESLQGRSEIAHALRADYDRELGIWRVIRQKVSAHGVAARLRIHVWPELKTALEACLDDGIVSPYVVHRLPARVRSRDSRAKGRTHPTQVLPADLSRAFAEARDKTGLWDKHPPTFHEIRALGASLKRAAGWSEKAIQTLMAHSEQEMTEAYLSKHELPWTEVVGKGGE